MKLRRANSTDLPFILHLEREWCDRGFVGCDDARSHERQIADPDWVYFVVEENGERAGYVTLHGLTSINRCIELKRIAIVRPGRGLGRQVLRTIIDMVFGEICAHRLWLDVYEDNHRARHVYRSLGFVEEGTLRECIKRGDQYRSLVVMSILESERGTVA
jgi:diamine N-acetyltransferase